MHTGYSKLELGHYLARVNILFCHPSPRPTSRESLLGLEDFPEAKADKFGEALLTVITDFCWENGLSTDTRPDIDVSKVGRNEGLGLSKSILYTNATSKMQNMNGLNE